VSAVAQLALQLPHRAALGRSDFLVADANAAAVAWLDAWPDWPSPGLVVWGAAGCGKSHLAATWQLRSSARSLAGDTLSVASLPEQLGDAKTIVLEDVDRATPDERTWLHLYNLVAERGGQMLLTARTAPARWNIGLADLSSRLKALATVEIAAPDEILVEAVLVKHFADRQMRVPPETVRYVAARLERSLAAVAQIAERLDTASLAAKRPATIPLARDVLRGLGIEG
jgi:chromosomal replication initiation ATPase DnaA